MGNYFTRIWETIFGIKETRILMVGLDYAGKTTILYKLKLGGEIIQTIPTIGFNVESIEYKNLTFVVWDVRGQDKSRLLWKHYFPDTKVLIFVVDSTDKERIGEVKEEIHKLNLEDGLKNVPFLFLANKQDLPGGFSADELIERLDLNSIKNRKWHIQVTSAFYGDGLNEGFDWIVNHIKNRN